MNPSDTASTERKTDRLEAFSDAVLAIAITLPITELHAPKIKSGGDLAKAYAELTPDYFAYALSCIVIGLYWAHSHFSGKIVRKTDHGFNLLTVLFLASVSITPFPVRPFIEHLSDPFNIPTAATVYACLLALPALAWLIRWVYATRQDLLDPRLTPQYVSSLTLKYALTAAALLIGAALTAWVNWRLGIGLSALIILGYLVPPMKPKFKAGQEPKDELEEATEG